MMNNWRQLLLAILLISTTFTLVELLLLEHTEEWTQLIPVVLLALMSIGTLALLISPARWLVNLFRALMVLSLISALAGLILHYQANAEFVLERYPQMKGWALFSKAMMGGMPSLAPGAMAQFALMGLLATLPRRA